MVIALILALVSCNGPLRSSYRPVLPKLPEHWEDLLGLPHWRLEWINESGAWQEWEGMKVPEISLCQEWTIPVLAWPFWPEKGLLPAMMRPCGALFPWDASGGKLALSWKGGVDGVFWKEMALAERSSSASEGRLPWYLDWPRFRDLMESENIPLNVRTNPWLADWKSIAQRTVQMGFDRRRIVSRTFLLLAVPGLGGRWTGSSPFESPLEVSLGEQLSLLVCDVPDVWVSSGAVLKCSSSGWVYREL